MNEEQKKENEIYLAEQLTKKEKIKIPQSILLIGFTLALTVILFFLMRPYITGYVTSKDTFIDVLNIKTDKSIEYQWTPENPGTITSLRVSGELSGNGNAKIYIETSQEKKLIYESSQGESLASILTGLSIAPTEEEQEEAEKEIKEAEKANEKKTKEESQPEKVSETPEAPTEEAQKEQPEQPEENATAEENITEEEKEKIKFDDVCIETCSVELNETKYKIIIETDSGTELKLQKIIYTLKKEEIPEENIIKENLTEEIIQIENLTTINITNITEETNFIVEYEIIEEDSKINAVIDSINYDNESGILNVSFHHESNEIQPIAIISEDYLDYFLSKNESSANENISLTINNWNPSKYFEIKIGKHSQVIGIGEIPEYDVNAEVKDANGNPIDVTIEFEKPVSKEVKKEISGKAKREKVQKGKYNIKIKPEEGEIKEIIINEININDSIDNLIDIDTNVSISGFIQSYAIDPTIMPKFTFANITVTAQGSELYKCKDWNFSQQVCYGEWIKIMDITPGQEYTFTLTLEDPAYSELLNYSYNVADILAIAGSWEDNESMQIRWDISKIPKTASITSALMCVYFVQKDGTFDTDAIFWRVDNQTWTESITPEEYNEMPLTNETTSETWSDINVPGWGCIDIKNVISTDLALGNNFSTVRICDADYPANTAYYLYYETLGFGNWDPGPWLDIEDRENHHSTGNRPYLNITYELYGEDKIQFDSSSSAKGAGNLTFSHTIGNNSNRILIVGATAESSASGSAAANCRATSVTYNNISLTKIAGYDFDDSGADACASLWYLLNPPVGTASIKVNYAGNVTESNAGGISIYNAKQQAPENYTTKYCTGCTSINTSITTLTSDSWIIDVVVSGNLGGFTANSGQIERWDSGNSTSQGAGSTKEVSTAGLTTIGWSQSANRLVHVAAAFAPAGSTDTTPPSSVTNLNNQSSGYTWIYWNWTNPADVDFNSNIIFIDNVNVANTSNNYYNATGLSVNSEHTIKIWTKDNVGNINNTNVTNTAKTLEDDINPVISLVSPTNGYIELNTLSPTFTYNVSDDSGIKDCFFILSANNGGYAISFQDETITKNTNQTFSENLLYNGNYTWKIICSDEFGNTGMSEERNIVLQIQGVQEWIVNNTRYYMHNESDSQFTNYKQLKLTTNDTSIVTSPGVSVSSLGFRCFDFNWTSPNWTVPVMVNGTWNFTVYGYCGSTTSVDVRLLAYIFKLNSTDRYDIALTSQSAADVCADGSSPGTAVLWNYNLPSGSLTTIYPGERVGVQICLNVTDTRTTNAYIQWEDNVQSNVIIPISIYDNNPYWSNNQTSIVTTYSPTTFSLFNITWQDDIGIDKVYLESNYSGNTINYTMNIISGTATNGVYHYNATLPAGTFYWKSWANDTSNQGNSSASWTFTINQATPTLNYYLNGLTQNLTVQYPQQINASATNVGGTLAIYRDGTLITNGANYTLGVGYYRFDYNITGNQNYTSMSKTLFANVTKGANTGTLLLNGTVGDINLIYPSQVNASFTNSSTAILYRNGEDITNLNNQYQNLEVGYYNFTLYVPENQNYTAFTLSRFANISKANDVVNLRLNGLLNQNISITYPQQVNATAYSLSGMHKLYRNGNDVTNESGINISLAAGTYAYKVNSTGNANYTDNETGLTYYLFINKAPSQVNLTINSTKDNMTINQGMTININCSLITPSLGMLALYNNESLINSGNSPIGNLTTFSSAGLFNITCIYIETQNYSTSYETYYVNVNEDEPPFSVTLLSPNNNAVDGDGFVEFNCSAADDKGLASISLILNGILNQTNSVSGLNNQTSFSLNLVNGNYNWSCSATDISTNTNASLTRYFTVNVSAVPSYNPAIFSGNTTNWSAVPDLSNVCNSTAILDNPLTDMIIWHNCINAIGQNFTLNVILENNNVTILTENMHSSFNSSATIIMRNLTWDAEPLIYKDNEICSETECIINYYDNINGILSFNVTHFTSYVTQGNSQMIIWDETDTGMPYADKIKYKNQQTKFFVNYSRKNNGQPITGANCTVRFFDLTDTMTYNTTSTYYEYNRSFSSPGIFDWNVTCSASGFQTLTTNDTANISVDNIYPEIYIISPINTNYNNKILLVNISVTDNVAVDKIWFNWNGTNQTYITETYITFNEGTNTLYAYTNDTSGNTNFTNVTFFIDSIAPHIQITYPQNISYNYNVNELNYTVSDINLQACWYSTNLGVTNTTVICGQNITGMTSAEGSNTWIVYANDSAGNLNYSSVTFFKDTIPPSILFISPINKTYNNNTILVNISSDGIYIWWNNGTTNLTYSEAINYYFADGSHTIKAYANDSVNNIANATVTFSVDTTVPSIDIISPSNLTYTNKILLVNISSSGEYTWFNWNGTNQTYITETYITFNEGTNTLYAFTNNSAGTINTAYVTFFIDSIAPYWTNNKTNANASTKYNDIVYFNITLNDANPGSYIFSYDNGTGFVNESGLWTNSNEITKTKTITATRGQTIRWYWWFNDSVGNYNQTDIWNTTIANTPPTISNVDIKPDNPITTDDLYCNYTYSDADNDPESETTFKWFKDYILQPSLTTKAISNTYTNDNEVWMCEVTPKDGYDFGNAVNSTTEIIGGSNPSIVSYSANSNSTSPKNVGEDITFTVDWIDLDQPNENISLYVCNTSTITAAGCSEKTFCSKINSSDDPISCNYTALESDNTTNVYYIAICDDSGLCSGTSSGIFEVNHRPSILTASITPLTAYINDVLTCSATYLDSDSDSVTSSYRWFKNSVWISGQTASTFNCSTLNCIKNDVITCEQTPTDEHNFSGNAVNTTRTISNSPPQFSGTIPDQSWYSNQNKTDVFNLYDYFSDVDRDLLTFASTGTVNITVSINSNGNVSFSKPSDWTGTEYVVFTANDSEDIAYSNNVTLTVLEYTQIKYDRKKCIPNWQCSEWSKCINNTQTRNCIDLNNCTTLDGKPAESQPCILYVEIFPAPQPITPLEGYATIGNEIVSLSAPKAMILPVLEKVNTVIILKNNLNRQLTNVDIKIETPKPDCMPQEIHQYPKIGWGISKVIGGISIKDKVDYKSITWNLQPLHYDKIMPGEELNIPIEMTTPAFKEKEQKIKIEIIENNTIILEYIMPIEITYDKFFVISKNKGSNLRDIFIGYDNENQDEKKVNIEFTINKDKNILAMDYLGPYTIAKNGKLFIAQKYELSNRLAKEKNLTLKLKLQEKSKTIAEASTLL
ncbi:MAG: hypothetical protein QW041_01885 [Candidatus Pacearchaeota archaeon]